MLGTRRRMLWGDSTSRWQDGDCHVTADKKEKKW